MIPGKLSNKAGSTKRGGVKTAARAAVYASLLAIVFSTLFMRPPAVDEGRSILHKSALIMGTIVEIDIAAPGGISTEQTYAIMDRALDEMRRIDALFSVHNSGSEISRINRLAGTQGVMTDPEVFNLIDKAVYFSDLTMGSFDITVKPLVEVWAQAGRSGRLPSDHDIRVALDKIGSQNIILNEQDLSVKFARDGMGIDMGGIAKGYAVDRAVQLLKDSNITDAVVNCGGHLYCLGRRSNSREWAVGIRHPRKKGQVFGQVAVQDMAIDTSGDYERYFIISGKRYPHIIDPRTGYPIDDHIVSASVIARDSVTADALATALCILGRDGMAILKNFKDTEALLVLNESGILKTSLSSNYKARYGSIEEEDLN